MDNSQDYDDFPDMPELLAQANARQVALNKAGGAPRALSGASFTRRSAEKAPGPLSSEAVNERVRS
jgi:hypothetical protein